MARIYEDTAKSVGNTPPVVKLAALDTFAGKTIVVVLPDAGERYLSSALFDGIGA